MSTVREVADGRVSVTDSSGDGLLEVAASGVTKASALAQLAALWGIDAADAIAFGDMPNDLEMLQWAGRSVAMANAHADVAAVASEIGADHADDGVGRILERWF
jgi:hydroxymethylpyrimidine pyrophosphatase-like HAD family hydrolase